jgi:hypothetical protein
MSRPVEVPAALTIFGAAPTRATLTLIPHSLGWRLARALGVLAACWRAAAVSVFIPAAHFLLCPPSPLRARSGPSSGSASTSGWSESAASVPDVDAFKTSVLGASWRDSRLSTVPTASTGSWSRSAIRVLQASGGARGRRATGRRVASAVAHPDPPGPLSSAACACIASSGLPGRGAGCGACPRPRRSRYAAP